MENQPSTEGGPLRVFTDGTVNIAKDLGEIRERMGKLNPQFIAMLAARTSLPFTSYEDELKGLTAAHQYAAETHPDLRGFPELALGVVAVLASHKINITEDTGPLLDVLAERTRLAIDAGRFKKDDEQISALPQQITNITAARKVAEGADSEREDFPDIVAGVWGAAVPLTVTLQRLKVATATELIDKPK